jgi:putative ABC transport system permease protein
MSKLNRKLIRDLGRYWNQVAAIVAVVALGIIMFSGPLLAQRDLRQSVDDIYDRTRYEDFSAEVETAPAESTSLIREVANVSAVEGRHVSDVLGKIDTERLTLRVITVPGVGRPSVNDLIVEDGEYIQPGDENVCMVEHHLAEQFNLEPGDKVRVPGVEGPFELTVASSVVSPEYLWLVRNRAEYVSDPAGFGVIFVTQAQADRMFRLDRTVNNYVVRVASLDELGATMNEVAEILEPYNLVGLTRGSEEPGALTLSQQISDMGKLALFFAVLLLAVAALALYITMTQIVFSQQRQIGVSRAVGYGGRTITVHYLGYGAVMGGVGAILGVTLGYLLSIIFIRIYAGIFELPMIRTSLYWQVALAGVGVGLAFSVAGAVVPARHAVKMKPAEAMRVEAGLALGLSPKKHRRGLTERLRLPVWLRVSFRNLFRNRRRTVLTFLGVLATLCLLVTATGGKDSLDYSVEKYLNGVLGWDVAAVWPEPVSEAEALERVGAIDGVALAEPLLDAPVRITAGGESVDVQLQAYIEDSALHGKYPTPGSAAGPGAGEILLNRGVTRKLPVDIGGEVKVSTEVGSLEFEIAGFMAEPFGGVAYVNYDYAQGLIGAVVGVPDPVNAVVMKVEPGESGRVVSALEGLEGVSQVITKEGLLSVFQELVGAVKTLFVIFYVMAFAMGFAILFSMITVNLLERRREIATFRTLGAGMGRIFSFVTVETMTVVLAALLPGILLGRLLEWVVIEKLLSTERLVPDTVISGVTIAVVVVAAIVVTMLSELPSIRKLWHLDLATVTKERAD